MQRTWEIDNNHVMPVDLVREQDFILQVRRLQKVPNPHLVVNLVLNAIPALSKSRSALEQVQGNLKDFVKSVQGEYAEMSNGDVFIIRPETGDPTQSVGRLIKFLPVDGLDAASFERFVLVYHMPRDYTVLRERANHYVEAVRSAPAAADVPANILKSDMGPLTPWNVDQISKLLDDIDVRTYARTQPIYSIDDQGKWKVVSEEYFISFDDLRRERFPKLDLVTPEHLFLALCEKMDQKLLSALAEKYASIADRNLHFNLSVATVVGVVFAHFTHSVPKEKRGLLTFELHRGDLFQDFARTLSAIEVLHMEGFKVAIDSVTPDMLPYLNVGLLGLDRIKINVSRERVRLLEDATVRKMLGQLPADKIVFFRCDSDKAFKVGRELGIKLFQGWHIDDIAGGVKK